MFSRRTIASLLSCRAAAANGLDQTPPPSYIVVMEEMEEEGLPSYEEAVIMVGQVMKQDMVSQVVKEDDRLPSYEEVYRVGEEGTEVLEEALDEVKVEDGGTEIAVMEETLEEVKVAEEKLNSITVVEVEENL